MLDRIGRKIDNLSPELRKLIVEEDDSLNVTMADFLSGKYPKGQITNFAKMTLRHCNGGATLDSALWLKNHLNKGGKLVVSISGALSSFQIGIILAPLIRAGKVHLISATGANHEESYYRYVASKHYAHIPRYTELTPLQEAELRDAGLRRITDTFLPEEESVRIIEPHLVRMMEAAEKKRMKYFPHEYFWQLYKDGLIRPDSAYNQETCWTLAAAEKNIPIVVPGFEDSTMGNIFAAYCYRGVHANPELPFISQSVMRTGMDYFHFMYDWYMKESQDHPIAFLQLGGGIAADFPICVVPALKHDLGMAGRVRDWAGFIEINPASMSLGSYSGAGGKEKITWDKLSTSSYYNVIQADVTVVAPWIAAILLDL